MLLALMLASAVLLEAALAAHYVAPGEESPWGSAAHQGLSRLSAAALLSRPRSSFGAEKRHQSLLPYHPVVRFRGLGGPGEAWGDTDMITAALPDLNNAFLLAIQDKGIGESELREALEINAGDLLKALETLANKPANSAKGIRFGIRR